jgi:hypothetical protein
MTSAEARPVPPEASSDFTSIGEAYAGAAAMPSTSRPITASGGSPAGSSRLREDGDAARALAPDTPAELTADVVGEEGGGLVLRPWQHAA